MSPKVAANGQRLAAGRLI